MELTEIIKLKLTSNIDNIYVFFPSLLPFPPHPEETTVPTSASSHWFPTFSSLLLIIPLIELCKKYPSQGPKVRAIKTPLILRLTSVLSQASLLFLLLSSSFAASTFSYFGGSPTLLNDCSSYDVWKSSCGYILLLHSVLVSCSRFRFPPTSALVYPPLVILLSHLSQRCYDQQNWNFWVFIEGWRNIIVSVLLYSMWEKYMALAMRCCYFCLKFCPPRKQVLQILWRMRLSIINNWLVFSPNPLLTSVILAEYQVAIPNSTLFLRSLNLSSLPFF